MKDIRPGAQSSHPFSLANVNGTLFFQASDDMHPSGLWKSDGTAAGTVLVADLAMQSPAYLTNVNGTLYFQASDGVHGYELWKSDGTTAGTVMVADINPGADSLYPSALTNVNGTLYLRGWDAEGSELWKSDGTAAGTVKVKDIRPGGNGSFPTHLTDFNGTLYFQADDGLNGAELWKSDGTADGTVMAADIFTGSSSYPEQFANVNGTLFFRALGNEAESYELWKSDGTAAGTVKVKDIRPGTYMSSNASYLTNFNGMLYFQANDGVNGAELWKSDGTAAGTVMVANINALGDSSPSWLATSNGLLYFSANDGAYGNELWKSDGTAAGTALVADIYPSGDSYAVSLTDVNGMLFFQANDGVHGNELWRRGVNDSIAPTVNPPTWSSNPLAHGQNTTLSTVVTDDDNDVESVMYTIDGGTPQSMTQTVANGTWKATFGSELSIGTYNITITATDQAGNSSASVTSTLTVLDQTPPTVTGHADRSPTSFGWFNAPVVINWTSNDPAPSSGTPTVPSPTTISADGANQPVTSGLSCDPAGNCATGQYIASIDQAAPSVTYSLGPAPNGEGWNNTDVTVTFTCADGLSGIATCSGPVTVATNSAAQTVFGTALDKAGNGTAIEITIKLDKTAPSITATPYPAANGQGWNNTDVAIVFACSDNLSGLANCSNSFALATEGANQTVSGQAIDRAGNTATATLSINIDKTAPTMGTPAWTVNPKPVDTPSSPVPSTLSVPAADSLAGVTRGEYFIGPDPGIGIATPMPFASGNLTAALGSQLPVGVYDIGIRALDNAGNWTAVITTMLVVYDPVTALGITGKNKKDLVPRLANGDHLPGLISNTQNDTADYGFTIDYRNGSLDPRNDFHFKYTTGSQCNSSNPQNCHSLTLDATTVAWLVIDQTNSSRGRFQGTATVTTDGATTSNVFTVEGIDGDRLSSADDHFLLKIFAANTNPDTATPLYQASGSLAKGNSIRIR
ncbi:hypothetical protein Rhe02_14780 [Rhizocola hellebori]|uniref:Bacterial Ig-like domain-containing protein n=1 Tax=Rhizocola hellebori TaxID=1392758 RepID=A0A8J3Q4V4_9ACTN|nr:hypothetical protein Rhe02_14780 [Rhizocola hellebori]